MMLAYLFGGVVVGGAVSARWNWWRRPKAGIPILMYHKVGDAPAGSQLTKLWVSQDMFRRQMSYLSKHGYHPMTFHDLYNHWDGITPLPSKPVIITFDDGYLNNYTQAFPVLKDFGFRATLFVVVDTVGRDNQWHDPKSEVRIEMVSWAQLKELQKAGWEIGSHTLHHHNLTKIDLKDVKVEMEESRRVIGEFLGQVPQTFAYPYGAGEDDKAIRNLAQQAGYRVAVGVHPGKWTSNEIKAEAFHLPRIFVRGDENMFDFHLQMTRGKCRL